MLFLLFLLKTPFNKGFIYTFITIQILFTNMFTVLKLYKITR